MQALVCIGCVNAGLLLGEGSSNASFPFSPIRFICLIGWVYLCLYSVQSVQFGLLVPKKRKRIANVAALFIGPLLLFVLLIMDTAKKAAESSRSFFEVIWEQLQNIAANIRSSGLFGSRDDSTLKIFDSSGRNIKEIYSHGKSSRDIRTLELTEQIITKALEERASDILIDPKDESKYVIRLRVDGMLRAVDQIEAETCQAVINSIKVVSSMDIAERRRPQDGAFMAKTGGGTVSFRVASAGVLNGEKLSVRVLNQNAGAFKLDNIGMSEKQQVIIREEITKPAGMILLCGPTGSGKTTTMYAMLNEIDLFTRNVITVEDPIEYVLPDASQIEVNPKADITFAKALRSIFRQDPDVICIGEIRDEETAGIALRASQTGHLVLATIHSDSNASALIRLLDLGVTPLLMSSGLSMVVSQRLLRKLCEDCKVRAELSPGQISEFHKKGINYSNIFQAKGCKKCWDTGYRGRIAVFDILVLNDQLKANIANSQLFITEMKKEGEQKGRSNLCKQGLKQVVCGITTLGELKRTIG